MINRWKEITQDNKVKLIIFIFGAVLIPVVGYFGNDWLKSPSTLSIPVPASVANTVSQGGVIQTNQSGQNIVNTGSGTVNIDITPKRFDQNTEGWCSPAVNDTDGNVTINCHGVSPKIAKRLEEH